MHVHKIIACFALSIWLNISIAQTKTTQNENNNNSRGFVQFNSDGKIFGMSADKEPGIRMTSEVRYSAAAPQLVVALYSTPSTRDTIVIYLYDNKGLTTTGSWGLSQNAKVIFIYRLFGKGIMTKSLDNSKNEITATNYIRLTKLEGKAGGTVEGVFNFTDIPFQNSAGKVVAKIKGISDGHFKTTIAEYNEIKGNPASGTVAGGAQGKLSPVANLLFKDVKCKLTDPEKNHIADATGFILSGKAEEPFAMSKESLDYPYSAQVTITDMNKDGIDEVFIQYGNDFTSGNTGSSIVLFIKDNKGVYQPNLGFPGIVDPQQLKTGFGGYPDLMIGGPGFSFPIWRRSGKEYKYYKTQKQ